MLALARFGAPEKYVAAVKSIYSNRSFRVKDAGATSESHAQPFGISQGCPLSPFLFSIVMTLLMQDASRDMLCKGLQQDDWLHLSELIYADDTLIVGVSDEYVREMMESVRVAGGNYGLAFNWGSWRPSQSVARRASCARMASPSSRRTT